MEIAIQELSPGSFAPFGELVECPSRQPDATGTGWSWWAETVLLPADARPYGVGYLSLQPADLSFDWAERHLATVEMLIPASGECLVYVAPANDPEDPDGSPSPEDYQIFRVRQGQGVLLRPGVWHGAPLALDDNVWVFVLLLQNTGRDDTRVVRFPETPITIQS